MKFAGRLALRLTAAKIIINNQSHVNNLGRG